jgi:hypothetical protein
MIQMRLKNQMLPQALKNYSLLRQGMQGATNYESMPAHLTTMCNDQEAKIVARVQAENS